jgi:hypothetical protein
MFDRPRLEPTDTLERHLSKEASGCARPPTFFHLALSVTRRAPQSTTAETGSHISEWLRSLGLQPPK